MNLQKILGPQASSHLRLIGMALLWGASWPAGRIVAQHMPPMAASGLRFVLASLVLLPWLYMAGGMGQLKTWSAKRWLGMAAAAAVGVFGYAAFFLSGLQHLPASKAALVITLNPVLTLLLAAWIFRERLNRTIGLGMLVAAIGAVLVISHGNPWQLLSTGLGLGELMILGCVACWVSYTLIGRAILTGVDALSTTAVTSTMGAIMLLLGSLVLEGPQGLAGVLHADAGSWGALLFLAWGSTALAYAWYFDGVKALGAGAASGYITLVPVIGVICSALWLGESVDASMLIGGALAVAGTAVMNWGRRTPAPAAVAAAGR
ncbi:DMT family transporter [Comamonas sp. J-3]|jgi:drug/metabolite transporter (DMT)-like permease|uniref:DMT family transporter n=1 Tax=Comamonas trifloxystrobinivorans TaxID=3350256 RepID=UPI003728D62B